MAVLSWKVSTPEEMRAQEGQWQISRLLPGSTFGTSTPSTPRTNSEPSTTPPAEEAPSPEPPTESTPS